MSQKFETVTRGALVSLLALMSAGGAANAAITDAVFGPSQIFDVQYYWSDTTLNASSFVAPKDPTRATVAFTDGQ